MFMFDIVKTPSTFTDKVSSTKSNTFESDGDSCVKFTSLKLKLAFVKETFALFSVMYSY